MYPKQSRRIPQMGKISQPPWADKDGGRRRSISRATGRGDSDDEDYGPKSFFDRNRRSHRRVRDEEDVSDE